MVGLSDKAADGGLSLGRFGEEPPDSVEPRTRGWREVKDEARPAREPLPHLRVLVDGVIVEDHVNRLSDRHLRLNGIQEADELLMPMALHTSADHLAFEHVESSEPHRCAVALVVVGHRTGAPFFIGSQGWVRSRAWICDFSSTESTKASAGRST
jgi:hypothetical protein